VQRVSVVGCSGSGKSTLARRLSGVLGVPHIELDALHWGPDWSAASAEELSERVRQATAADAWVVDGSYQSKLGTLVWERADTVVWV
jgi:adenylate kinase family enzyme